MDSDGFQIVRNKNGSKIKHKRSSRSQPSRCPTDQKSPKLTLPSPRARESSLSYEEGLESDNELDVASKVKEALSHIKSTAFYPEFEQSVLTSLEIACQESGDTSCSPDMVCYGVGSFAQCPSARYQLAAFILLTRKLKVSRERCLVYDPVLSGEELAALHHLGLTPLPHDEQGSRTIEAPTLFFMPHCPKPLYHNLLRANWSQDRLSKSCIVGNGFCSMNDSLPSSMLLRECPLILRVGSCCRETAVNNIFRYFDVFNDLAVHVFPKKVLETVPKDFWTLSEVEDQVIKVPGVCSAAAQPSPVPAAD